ncbi:short chain fatty acid transporter [Natronolimnohabitans innermongolicus JCM 12255]|uniref:Short chain fatty acid transporter n=1 Tax=Natronolimnohabitans innermongolicus JCM 12255 TaxID=1227499 RepID=L9XJI4_9EURY|nr:short chain fatty acid transporter [Natronolimnohabitans innermongolicus JCM 12255]
MSVGVEKYMPHSFVFAIILTFIACGAALLLTPTGPGDVVIEWNNEFWGFLEFAMQLVIIIVTGYGIASAPVTRRAINRLVRVPNTPLQAYLSIAFFGFFVTLVHWGLGLVTVSLYTIFLGKERDDVDFGFSVAMAYAAATVGSAGSISQTAPLLVNTPGHFMEDQIGRIPLNETIFSLFHLSIVWGVFVVLLVIIYFIYPTQENTEPLPDAKVDELLPEYQTDFDSTTLAGRFNDSRVFNLGIVLLGGSISVWLIATQGAFEMLELNTMNLIFLTIGIALHGNVVSYAKAITDGAERCGQVILQFPFYGGIQGILIGTGLTAVLVDSITAVSSAETFPFFTWLMTGIVNVFVPSGGGQYIVTAEVIHPVAESMGVSHAAIVSAYTVGDVWTNLLNPFWALPVLGIVGLQVRDIWGYVIMVLISYGVIAGSITLLFPLLGLV